MKYSTILHDNYVILHLQEEKLNSTIAPELKSAMIMYNAQGQRNIILDMSEVQFADSSGLSALLRANSLCTGSQGIFVVFGVTPHVRKLIEITHLDRVFHILPTQQESIEAVFMHEIESSIDDDDTDADGDDDGDDA
jgi:anti-sigma B factor antagonist